MLLCSQFLCRFAEAHIQRHSPAQMHTKTTENDDRIGRLYPSEDAARGRKDGTEGGTKEEHFKNTSEHRDQRGEKSMCAERENKIINSE